MPGQPVPGRAPDEGERVQGHPERRGGLSPQRLGGGRGGQRGHGSGRFRRRAFALRDTSFYRARS